MVNSSKLGLKLNNPNEEIVLVNKHNLVKQLILKNCKNGI